MLEHHDRFLLEKNKNFIPLMDVWDWLLRSLQEDQTTAKNKAGND